MIIQYARFHSVLAFIVHLIKLPRDYDKQLHILHVILNNITVSLIKQQREKHSVACSSHTPHRSIDPFQVTRFLQLQPNMFINFHQTQQSRFWSSPICCNCRAYKCHLKHFFLNNIKNLDAINLPPQKKLVEFLSHLLAKTQIFSPNSSSLPSYTP